MSNFLDYINFETEVSYQQVMDKIGENVAEIRKNAKKTQEVLAKELGISRTHLAKIETGKRGMSMKLIYNFCKNLNINPIVLFKEL